MPPSYGGSARGRPRSRLAGGAWSRPLQARLGRVSSYDLSKSAAALTYFGSFRRARGAPPREEPPPRVSSYELSKCRRAMGTLREAARDRDWQGGLGLAHSRLGSVEFRVMIYRNQPPRLPSLASLRARKARRHGEAAATGRAPCGGRYG